MGRAVLGIAGAYLLRAVAESSVVPRSLVLFAAVLYACGWMFWAARAASTNRFASATYAVTSAMILSPLVWESTVRLKVLSPALASVPSHSNGFSRRTVPISNSNCAPPIAPPRITLPVQRQCCFRVDQSICPAESGYIARSTPAAQLVQQLLLRYAPPYSREGLAPSLFILKSRLL